jgi:hypothetical protein
MVGQQPVDLRRGPDLWRGRLVSHPREELVAGCFNAGRVGFPSCPPLGGNIPGPVPS